jgi:hypothetical protein
MPSFSCSATARTAEQVIAAEKANIIFFIFFTL